MNRHQRRAQASGRHPSPASQHSVSKALETLQGLQEFSNIAERIQPYLTEIESLAGKLDEAKQQLSDMGDALTRQREVFLNLIAVGMNISIEDVTKLEASINQKLYGSPDGIATAESTEATTEENDSGSGT